MVRKIVGVAMLSTAVCLLFIGTAVAVGLEGALIIWGVFLTISFLVVGGITLIESSEDDE